MLRITINTDDSSQFNFADFENYQLPSPPSGVDTEINNDLILNFEDEEEAIRYAEQLEDLSGELDDKESPQYIAISTIIVAIRNDEFVQSYIQ